MRFADDWPASSSTSRLNRSYRLANGFRTLLRVEKSIVNNGRLSRGTSREIFSFTVLHASDVTSLNCINISPVTRSFPSVTGLQRTWGLYVINDDNNGSKKYRIKNALPFESFDYD